MSKRQRDLENITAGATVFVQRLRRVAQHSLARDWDYLAHLEQPQFHVRVDPRTGTGAEVVALQDEEAVESLAARLRPLILQSDAAHYGNGLNRLSELAYMNGHQSVCAQLRSYRRRWIACDPSDGAGPFYIVQVGRVGDQDASRTMDDSGLAMAWFYGDVVHADPEHRSTSQAFGIENRFQAATLHVARLAGLAVDTLSFVTWLRDESLIDLPEAAFSEPVTVERRLISRKMRLFTAPVGSDIPASPDVDFGPEWRAGIDVDEDASGE